MRIGVLGPGVIGSVVGATLSQAGHDVTLVGRGARLRSLSDVGLVVVDDTTMVRQAPKVSLSDDLARCDRFDALFVAVRADQVTAALKTVASVDNSSCVITLTNHALGVATWADIVGPRLCHAFPGISGKLDAGVVHYRFAPSLFQPTWIGEGSGDRTERIVELHRVLSLAGIPARIHVDIDAWLRFHAAWIHVLPLGLLVAGGNIDELVGDRALHDEMVAAMRDGIRVVHALGFEVTPDGLRWVQRAPRMVLSTALRLGLGRPEARAVFSSLGSGQRSEAIEMASQIRTLAERAGVEAAAHQRLALRASKALPN